MNKMTAGEAAHRIEEHNRIHFAKEGERAHFITQALNMAASVLRRVESGELREMVHAHWNGWTTSAYIGSEDEFGDPKYADRKFFRCSKCRYGSVIKSHYCPSCGALMDGKDNSHA